MAEIPNDVDFALVEIGVRDLVDQRMERLAAVAVLAVISANPSAKICVTVSGWDEDSREVWEIPEARDCVRRFADRVALQEWPDEAVLRHFHETTICALLQCEAWKPETPIRVVKVDPNGPRGHA